VLLVHQGVQITDKDSDVELYTDPVTPDTVYCSYLNSVYQIQLGLYSFLSDMDRDTTQLSQADVVVRQLVNMGSNTISGFAPISDVTLGLCYFCLSPLTGICGDALFPIITTPELVVSGGTPFKSKLQPFNYDRLNNHAKAIPQSSKSAPYPEFINENSIKDAFKQIETARNKIQDVISAFADLKERIALLSSESQMQSKVLESSSKKISSLRENTASRLERLHSVRKAQESQLQRASSLLEVLFDMTQPRLSAQEIQWFQELTLMLNTYQTKYVPLLHQVS
jgi:hypothetical protein